MMHGERGIIDTMLQHFLIRVFPLLWKRTEWRICLLALAVR